jgi:sporulation protein YlmC with PRC-barrel domain
MIEINIGAVVESNGHEVGRVERVILDGATYEATHLVVKHGNPLNFRYLLMPLDWVETTGHDYVRIDRGKREIEALPNFEVQHYVGLDQLDQEHLEYPRSRVRPSDWINYFVPLVANAFGEPYHPPGIVVTDQLLSPSESAVKRGLPVESSDGHKVGEIQEVILSEPDWRLSGIVISRGFLLKHPMRVPGDWVGRIERGRIVLNRSKQQVEDWERQKG